MCECVCLQCVRKATSVTAVLNDVTALMTTGRDGQAELCVCVCLQCVRKATTVTAVPSDVTALIMPHATLTRASADVRQDGPENTAINVSAHLYSQFYVDRRTDGRTGKTRNAMHTPVFVGLRTLHIYP